MTQKPSQKQSPRTWVIILAFALSLFVASSAAGHKPGSPDGVGVVEKVGQGLPPDITCLDDTGRELRLAALLDRPAILSLVYFSCEHICPQVLAGLGRLVSDLDLEAGKDFRVVTVSFDPDDTPRDAAEARKNYTRPLGLGFPAEGWVFLTAGETQIARLTGALGFSFKKDDHGFTHPVILAVLSPGGRISRYVRVAKFNYGVAYPVFFPAVEMAESLRAAERGRLSAGPGGPLLFCFPHEPPGQAEFFSLMSLLGSVTLFGLAALFIYLAASRRGVGEDR